MSGCTKATAQPGAPPPPEVAVVEVAGEDVPVYREYPARTYARDMVEVRGRVDGYIERRTFDIGSDVKAGQVLYVLDVRPYQAKEEAAAKQDLDNALAALKGGQAAVSSRKANVEASGAQLRTAELNVEYATIRAPISGRIGDSLLQVGGLVSRSSAEPLTTIVPLDPIWVRFQISEAELLTYQRLDSQSLPIQLILSDGTVLPQHGRIENTLNGVNTRTGTMEVQARFQNADRTIQAGQFGRVRLRLAERKDAILVPQKAVQELQGLQSVLTVGPDNRFKCAASSPPTAWMTAGSWSRDSSRVRR